jgi:phosphomethylpyrimidine synthase
MKEVIIATRIADHAADIAKNIPNSRDWDNKMSKARQELNWERMFELCMDPEKAVRYRHESTPEHDDSCTMCGKMCSMRNMNKVIKGEDVNILRES